MPAVKFSNREVVPPKGGWHFPLQGGVIQRFSEGELIEEVVNTAKANGQTITAEQAEEQVWAYLCAREPQRCAGVPGTPPVAYDPAVLTPEVWGPWIWKFLNLAAVRYHRGFFREVLAFIPALMTCDKCRAHWREITAANPPDTIVDAKSACQWVNARHNEVNASVGKHVYPYERMVAEYGAPP